MKKCRECKDGYDDDVFDDAAGMCRWCVQKRAFSAFAASCGLKRYPDPTGERYVYQNNGDLDGKKVECTDFIDE